ncbi:MAG: hypothetical protein ACRYFX_09815 [Janthinobacterium lividum]
MAKDNEKREIEILLNAQQANASIKDMAAGVALMNNQLAKMGQDDPRRAQLQRDFQLLTQRVGAARAEMRTYVQTEEELQAATEKLNKENQQVILNGQKLNSSFREMKDSAALLEKQLEELSGDDPGRKKMLADYHALQERIAGVTTEMKGATEGTGFFKQGMATAFGVLLSGGIMGLAGKVVGLGKDIFDTTAKFQTFESVMTNALGDKGKAQQAMRDIQQMAAKTPFSVDELTGSFIKFVNRGLQPSMAEMTKMADIAASQGKSFDQLTEAVLDAGGGEFERLKEFGIKASKSGDEVSLSFKGVNQTVKNTPEAINGAIMAFGNMKGVAGSTAAISATLEGQLSNLGDSADQLKIKVGEGLKPAFTLILTLFGRFIDWIGRFVEAAAPLKSLFTDISTVVLDFYHEIGDVLESLGLFSEKTDTVKLAVEVLKFTLTAVLIPVKALFLAAKGVVDVFVDWYNKSELLRGILGGLGAAVVSTFTTIKDSALKILGGVGDILVGIFSLDKDKIVAGFKSAMSATADVLLDGGSKAAAAFKKGYEANKDNHITRTVRVKTVEQDQAGPAGVDLVSDKSGTDAAAEKKREAAEKKRLAALTKQHKQEEDAAKKLQLELYNTAQVAYNQNADLRHRELADIEYDALRKINTLTGSAQQIQAARLLIEQETEDKKKALQAKFDEQDKQDQQKKLDEALKFNDAATEEELAQLALFLAQKALTQQEYEEEVYQTKKFALDRELALVKQKYGAESAEYKKLHADMLKEQAAHTTKQKAIDADLAKFKKGVSKVEEALNSDNVKFLEESLGKQTVLYKAFQVARKLAAAAKIEVDLVEEIQGYWASSSEFGPAGVIWAGIQSGIAVVRAGVAMSQLGGFAKGGATGDGIAMQRPSGSRTLSAMGTAMGLGVGTNGKLVDAQGLDVAGLVHKNEYVIPEWMRVDPQVIQVENWLEARRQRGFYEGGPTSEGDTRAATSLPAAPAEATASNAQLVQVLSSLDQRLREVEKWPTQLEVVLDLLGLDREQEKLKQVKSKGSIK